MKDAPAQLIKNMDIMAKVQPGLAAKIQTRMDEMETFPVAQIKETPAGRWISGITNEPFFEPSRNEKVLKDLKREKSAVYMVLGLGYPPYLFEVLRGIPSDALSILVFEPNIDLIIQTLAMTSVYRAIPEIARLTFVTDDSDPIKSKYLMAEVMGNGVEPVGIFPVSKAAHVYHPSNTHEYMSGVLKYFKEEIEYKITSLGNSPDDTLLGIRYGALNAYRILGTPDIDPIRELFKGKPAIVVASGPSLAKNVHLLPDIQDRCLLVACDTSIKGLLKKGIKPHAVATIERNGSYQEWVPKLLDEFYEECKDILLVSQSVTEPMVAGRWPGPNVIVGKMDSPADIWMVSSVLNRVIMQSGMSVAHMAMSFAMSMGASTIALIGQDLAFGADESSHSDVLGLQHLQKVEDTHKKMRVPGALGGIVTTHDIWFYFLQIFERMISTYSIKVRDCTEGGALIAGTEVMPLSKFIDEEVSSIKPGDVYWLKRQQTEVIGEIGAATAYSVDKALHDLKVCSDAIDEMERGVDKAVAAALSPAQRQEHAKRAGQILDYVNHTHRVLGFVGQSYTHTAAVVMTETRQLDTVDKIEKWEAMNREVIAAHRSCVDFMRHWLEYVKYSMAPPVLEGLRLHDSMEGTENILPRLKSLLEKFFSSDGNLLSEDALLLSDLLCRIDLERCEEAAPSVIWNAARFLMLQDRSYESRLLMNKAYSILEGGEIPVDAAAQFFLDWARMEMAHDTLWGPNYEKSMSLLDSAREFDPSRADEAERERVRVIEIYNDSIQSTFSILKKDTKNPILPMMELHNQARQALSEQDLPRAFELVMELAISYDGSVGSAIVPDSVRWLANNAMKCRFAEDPIIAKASQKALQELWDMKDHLRKAGILVFGYEWMDWLRENNIDWEISTEDSKK